VRIQHSYQAHLDFVGRDQADIAYLGPVTYVHVKERYGEKPLLAKVEANGSPFFHGMIITRKDSDIKSLQDLVGKSFAFGDPNSTMSYVVPRGMLMNADVPISSLIKHDFLMSHHNVALAVLGGYFDAGAVKEEVYYEFEPKGIKMLAKSPPIPEHLFVARSNLPQELIAQMRSCLVNIAKSPEQTTILQSIKPEITNLLPVADQDYDTLRNILKSIGL
jgi:phosphonate transport system substrate-binding protein